MSAQTSWARWAATAGVRSAGIACWMARGPSSLLRLLPTPTRLPPTTSLPSPARRPRPRVHRRTPAPFVESSADGTRSVCAYSTGMYLCARRAASHPLRRHHLPHLRPHPPPYPSSLPVLAYVHTPHPHALSSRCETAPIAVYANSHSAVTQLRMRMPCARASSPRTPYRTSCLLAEMRAEFQRTRTPACAACHLRHAVSFFSPPTTRHISFLISTLTHPTPSSSPRPCTPPHRCTTAVKSRREGTCRPPKLALGVGIYPYRGAACCARARAVPVSLPSILLSFPALTAHCGSPAHPRV
ncbi:hypothetical protein C8F04DRAFT_1142924, partial [Mycena alexandri]